MAKEIFGQAEQVYYSNLNDQQQALAISQIQKKTILSQYVATDKKQVKTQKWYRPCLQNLEQVEIPARAKKRLELRAELLKQVGEFPLSNLRENYSADIIRFFQEKHLIEVWEKEVSRLQAFFDGVEPSQPLGLNPEQEIAQREILSQVGQEAQTYLLQGVTGSGKTEVYLQVIEGVLQKGKTAIMLVPEISLTPQVTRRFVSRFGQQVAILHSGLSDGEKYDEWRKIESGQARVVVGARSAIFAPLKNIGVIIIDEEHEATYKQESNPRYHARDVAKLRADYHQAALVLGSATPSLESRARASRGLYGLLHLTQRANPQALLPQVEVVDFRDYLGQQENGNYTPVLLEKIRQTLDRKEQVVLLLNRRGYSSFVMCRDCGSVDECPNCDISLTLHMDTRSMQCHYCGFQKAIPRVCPSCSSPSIRYYGTGTQKAFQELQDLFPDARILRMDVDTTRRKGSHEALLQAFGKGEADILLGTQMIAKGLDFPSSIRYYGTGTQRAFEELQDLFPDARILRMDVDTTRKKGSHENLLQAFGQGEADILLGTQMIAKGLDFPNVTLVGVLNADTALNLPDFRSSERTFQLLTQVAGRAGRAEKPGQVLIQTYNPNHYAIRFAQEQDYEGFYDYEMRIRRSMAYPPYTFTIGLTLSHASEDLTIKKAYEIVGFLRENLSDKIQILGPTPKPIARTHNLFHYQILLKYRREDRLEDVLNAILDWSQEKENKDLRLSIDHEPQNVM